MHPQQPTRTVPSGLVRRTTHWFVNLPVPRKLQLTLGATMLGLAASITLGMRATSHLGDQLADVGRQQLPAVRNMTLVDMMHDAIRAGVYAIQIAHQKGDQEALLGAEAQLGEHCGNLREFSKNLEQLRIAPETRMAIEQAKPSIESYVTGALSIGPILRDAGSSELPAAMTKFEKEFVELEERLELLGGLIEADAEKAVVRGEQDAATAFWQSLIMFFGIGGAAFAFSTLVGRRISRPLIAAVEVLESGDLRGLADVNTECEIGRMARAVTSTVGSIEAQKAEMARVVSMMENAPINMLYADAEGIIRYQNAASKQCVSGIASALGVDASAVVGSPISIFFRSCERQPTGLGDGHGLPYRATAEMAGEVVDLLVTALRDHRGEFGGPMLTWEIKTEQVRLQRQNEAMAAERQRQAEGERRRIEDQAARERSEAESIQHRIAEEAEHDRKVAQELQAKLDKLLFAVDQAAKGDLRQRLAVDGSDAVSKVGGALDTLFADLRTSIAGIARNATELATSSNGLRERSSTMFSAAETTTTELDVVSTASEEVNRNVQDVSTSTEGLSLRIREIASSAAEATRVASAAVEATKETESTMSRLGDSSQKIGTVVKLIHSIAQQTNLLALNATIEAARAGEAGRGFAVVANEVKELANATSNATGEISQRIDAIQGDARQARVAIGKIGEIVHRISDIQSTIAAAVEEQTATTKEIARTLAETAQGSSCIVSTIARVTQCASETASGAQQSLQSAKSLSKMADVLSGLVGAFRY